MEEFLKDIPEKFQTPRLGKTISSHMSYIGEYPNVSEKVRYTYALFFVFFKKANVPGMTWVTKKFPIPKKFFENEDFAKYEIVETNACRFEIIKFLIENNLYTHQDAFLLITYRKRDKRVFNLIWEHYIRDLKSRLKKCQNKQAYLEKELDLLAFEEQPRLEKFTKETFKALLN